ncbi:MAG: sugar transferase [Ignavibacteriaceae bacterium]|nr:sugar transferase [Ignavibacteriaceae bacterium]
MIKFPKFKYYLFVFDILIFLFSFFTTAIILKFKSGLTFSQILMPNSVTIFFAILSIGIFLFIYQYNSLYKINIILTRAAHLTAIIHSIFYGFITIIVISFLIKSAWITDSRLTLLTFTIILLLYSYVLRVEIYRRLYIGLKNKQFKRNLILVGGGKAGQLLATRLIFENAIGVNIIGFIDDNKKIGSPIVGNKSVIGNVAQIPFLVAKHEVDEILIVIDNITYERLLEILDTCKSLDVNVRLASELFDVVVKKVSTEKYAEFPVVDVSPRINNTINLLMKRFFDVISAGLGIIFLSPIFLTIALLIKLSSKGPVLFYQTRIGKNGQSFQMYKFRSMYVNKGEDEERMKMMLEFMKKEQNDSIGEKIINLKRVTKIGQIIRKTSLDELPQLFNVIRGDMSLVGPRPCLPYEYENYAEWQKRRLSVIPGCTGVWQVAGRSNVSFKDSVVLDLYYINNMSPWLDLQILFKTIPVILFARGGK